MKSAILKTALAGGVLLLNACAPQSEVRQMHREVKTLNHEMAKLSEQTVKLTQQNALNKNSSSGVYLLPGANTPARLDSQIGMLRMSLSNVSTDGSQFSLLISGESRKPLPAFSATVEWGHLQGTTNSVQEIDVQHQKLSFPAGAQASGYITVPLTLPGLNTSQPAFIRIHDIQPLVP